MFGPVREHVVQGVIALFIASRHSSKRLDWPELVEDQRCRPAVRCQNANLFRREVVLSPRFGKTTRSGRAKCLRTYTL